MCFKIPGNKKSSTTGTIQRLNCIDFLLFLIFFMYEIWKHPGSFLRKYKKESPDNLFIQFIPTGLQCEIKSQYDVPCPQVQTPQSGVISAGSLNHQPRQPAGPWYKTSVVVCLDLFLASNQQLFFCQFSHRHNFLIMDKNRTW